MFPARLCSVNPIGSPVTIVLCRHLADRPIDVSLLFSNDPAVHRLPRVPLDFRTDPAVAIRDGLA